jgi:hypothetical protein
LRKPGEYLEIETECVKLNSGGISALLKFAVPPHFCILL